MLQFPRSFNKKFINDQNNLVLITYLFKFKNVIQQ